MALTWSAALAMRPAAESSVQRWRRLPASVKDNAPQGHTCSGSRGLGERRAGPA